MNDDLLYLLQFGNCYHTHKNAHVVTDLQTSCCQADIRECSHRLFSVVVTSLEQVVIIIIIFIMVN
jgi:hypothetical protein